MNVIKLFNMDCSCGSDGGHNECIQKFGGESWKVRNGGGRIIEDRL
jgi:hypothetical protein